MTKELQKGCEVIISTPGQLIDMIKKKATNMITRMTFVVLDAIHESRTKTNKKTTRNTTP